MTATSGIEHKSLWQEIRYGSSRWSSVLFALIFKEFKVKLGKSKLGTLWVLLEPIISMSMISAIWLIIGRDKIDNTNVMLFIGSGFVVFIIVRRGIAPIPSGITVNQSLLNYPQVKPIDTILARYFLEMWLHMVASFLLFFTLWWVMNIFPSFPDPLEVIASVLVAMAMSLGIALLLAVYGTFYEGLMRIVTIISQPLMILSSVLYSMNDLPVKARDVLTWNPIVHIISSFRNGAFGTPLFRGHDLTYPAGLALILVGLGFVAYHANRFKLIQK